ncbi:hypothetical protein EJ04DRAFT_512650 [Polyplosphaeria fusca]|uniref:Uncharacterized protein n=1 Tax=Polyplosphaeria fusca TaxID=682080 RepID=A0A9P4UZJ1_9PLEO|nr:hypothetical protein EJ04DRAFT_512650 [Polyplosphaeria fusca]
MSANSGSELEGDSHPHSKVTPSQVRDALSRQHNCDLDKLLFHLMQRLAKFLPSQKVPMNDRRQHSLVAQYLNEHRPHVRTLSDLTTKLKAGNDFESYVNKQLSQGEFCSSAILLCSSDFSGVRMCRMSRTCRMLLIAILVPGYLIRLSHPNKLYRLLRYARCP